MAYNPYAPPTPGGQQGFTPQPFGGGGPQSWEPGEMIESAWAIVKVHWPTLIFAPLVGQFIANLPGQIVQGVGQATHDADTILITTGVGVLIGMIAGAFFKVGITKIMVSAARGQMPQFGDLFSGGSRFLALLLTDFLVGLCVMVGLLLLIVPGIYAALALSQTSYFVVDRGMGPIEAMKASWEVTEGQKGKIFLYGLFSFLIVLLGLVACCVGVFPAIAVVTLGGAIIYTRLTGTAGGSPYDVYGGGPPMGGPPGAGWGPPPPPGGFGAPPPPAWGPPGGGYGPPPGQY